MIVDSASNNGAFKTLQAPVLQAFGVRRPRKQILKRSTLLKGHAVASPEQDIAKDAQSAVESVTQKAPETASIAANVTDNAAQQGADKASEAASSIPGVSQGLDQGAGTVSEAVGSATDTLGQAADNLTQSITPDITPEEGQGLLDGFQGLFNRASKSINDSANNLKESATKAATSVQRPSQSQIGEEAASQAQSAGQEAAALPEKAQSAASSASEEAAKQSEALGSSAKSAADQTQALASSANGNSGLKEAVDKAASSSQSAGVASSSGVQQGADQAASAVESATNSSIVQEGANRAADAFSTSAGQASDTVSQSTGIDVPSDGGPNLLDGLKGGPEELQKQIQGLTSSLEGATGDVGKEITKQITDLQAGFSGAAEGAIQDASTSLESFRGAATGIAGDLSNQAIQQANNTLYTLPEPVRETIQAILKPIAQALEVPPVRNSAVLFAVGYPAYLWFTARFGGFSGRLSPLAARKVLETEDSLLLDVRPDNARDIAGIPELRAGAKNKGVALPLLRVKQKTGTQVVKANVLSFQVAALLVQGLSKVSKRTKIIVLSDSETQAVKLARAIAAEAKLPAYILKDGVNGWVAAGLPLSEESDYDTGPIAGLSGAVEGRLLPWLRDPFTAIGAIFLSLTISAAIIDEHKTLQFIGALGLTFTIGSIPVRYNSLREARDDLLGPFLRVISAILNLVPKSAGTSAVTESSSPASLTAVSKPKPLPSGDDDYDSGYGDILAENTGTQVVGQKTPNADQTSPKTSPESPKTSPKANLESPKASSSKDEASELNGTSKAKSPSNSSSTN